MKTKITLFSALMIATGVSVAQKDQGEYSFGIPQPAKEKTEASHYQVKPVSIINQQSYEKNLNVLYSEDFSTGYVAGSGGVLFSTDNGDYTGNGANSNYWATSTLASVLGVNMGMTGRYLLWNSYAANTSEGGGFSTTPVNGAVRTPVLDFSNVTSAGYILTFNTSSMYCCHPQEFPWEISASIDGGVTFGAGIRLDFGVDRNVGTDALATPLAYSVNISNLLSTDAIQNDQVVLEFRWVGDNVFTYQSGNFQYNTHYFWGLDNVTVFEQPEFEISLDAAWTGDIINDFEKSEIPLSLAGEFIAQAKLLNNGSENPSGVALKVTIMNGATEVATATGGTLVHGFTSNADTITFNTGINLAGLGLGNYTIVYEVEMTEEDAVLTNNTKQRSLKITENTYASYNADLPVNRESPGYFYSSTDASIEMQFGTLFSFNENVTVHGIELAGSTGFTSNPTKVDEPLNIIIYRVSESGYDLHAGPFQYEVKANKLTTNGASRYVYNLHMPDITNGGEAGEVLLMANEQYLVAFHHYGGDGAHFFFWGTPMDVDFSARMNIENTWYLMNEEALMALNIDEALTLSENEILTKSVSLYPNPVSNDATISFSLVNESAVFVEVRDLAGKLVYSANKGNMQTGSHSLNLSTNTFAEGMYTYTLTANGSQVTKKFIVKK
jgi:hypothetical protein